MGSMRIVLIIPTYNERGNIGRLIGELQSIFRSLADEMHILVVDDNSPDGTIDIVRECQRRSRNVHVLQGQNQGLGAAYIRGMRYALETPRAHAVVELAPDYSPIPQDVPRQI